MLLRLLLLLVSLPVQATLFRPVSVETQIKEADGIIIGHYLRKKSVRLEDGSIATQMIFKMNKEVGMQSDFLKMDEIIVHYPGGKMGDTHVRVEGVPSFVTGENVVLMIKTTPDRYWGLNLGLGTFKVISYGHEKLIVNTLFPEDRQVGQVKLDEFERLVKVHKGSSMKVVYNTAYPTESGDISNTSRLPASVSEGKIRAIASKTDQTENRENTATGISTMWLVFILAAMGGAFRLLRQKEAK